MISVAAARRDERGETLVELVVTVAILGIAGVAILSGLLLSVKASDVGRKQATGGAYVRSWAEVIQTSVDDSNELGTCAGYQTLFNNQLRPGNPALTGYTPAASCSGASGLQRVDLTLTSGGDVAHQAVERLTVWIRQPCNGPAATQGADPCVG